MKHRGRGACFTRDNGVEHPSVPPLRHPPGITHAPITAMAEKNLLSPAPALAPGSVEHEVAHEGQRAEEGRGEPRIPDPGDAPGLTAPARVGDPHGGRKEHGELGADLREGIDGRVMPSHGLRPMRRPRGYALGAPRGPPTLCRDAPGSASLAPLPEFYSTHSTPVESAFESSLSASLSETRSTLAGSACGRRGQLRVSPNRYSATTAGGASAASFACRHASTASGGTSRG